MKKLKSSPNFFREIDALFQENPKNYLVITVELENQKMELATNINLKLIPTILRAMANKLKNNPENNEKI